MEVDIPETLVEEQTKTKFANMMSDFKVRAARSEPPLPPPLSHPAGAAADRGYSCACVRACVRAGGRV